MAAQNGYSSDCGAPGEYAYNRGYQFGGANENEGTSDLSFLYDRAQGNTYGPKSQGVTTTQLSPNYTSPKSTDDQSNYSSQPSGDYYKPCVESDLGQGLLRATPAPAYPYSLKRDIQTSQGLPNAESLACPTGSYPRTNQWENSPPQVNCSDQQRGPVTMERQMSNLRVSNPNQSASSMTPSSGGSEAPQGQGPQGPRPRLVLRTESPAGAPSGVRTIDRSPQKPSGGHHNTPASSSTLDPRRNYIRQNIPWRDINAARKFSVPILNRPRLQVADHSSDDHMVNGADHFHQRSGRPALGEVDSSSVRQLLREGDEIGDYDQTSIRYKGRANPSKMFRFVQSAMGSSDTESIERHQNERMLRRRLKREEMLSAAAAEDRDALKDADDVVDISYVGPKIPSRTFRFLQEAIGARDQQVGNVSSPSPSVYNDFVDSPFEEQPARRSVKVVHLRPQKSLENLIGDF